MRPSIPLLCGILPAAWAFKFTGPDSDDKLDISQPVNITWTLDSSFDEPAARAFHLWFYAHTGDGESLASWAIQSNLSLSAGSYTWDSSRVVDSIEHGDNTLVTGKEHYFQARLVGDDGARLASVESDKYALEGYDFITNQGSRGGVEVGAFGVVAWLAVVGGVLL